MNDIVARATITEVFVLVTLLSVVTACKGPSQAKAMREQIRVGMSYQEVASLLRSNEDGHYFVKISDQDQVRPFAEFEKIVEESRGKKDTRISVNVLFMGPGYLHNEFDIVFGGDGMVEEVTPLKQWD